MALKDRIPVGMSLPHRSPDAIDMTAVRQVAERSEVLGFSDLWVTENTMDHVFSLDPAVILSYAAAVTSRIRLGVSVAVLPLHNPGRIAHQYASLDYVSRGRAILGVGIGREVHYPELQVPTARRVRRFRESIEIVKALWTQPKVDYQGDIYSLSGVGMVLRNVQQPHLPLWLGGDHPDAVRRAAALADGWMGSGSSGIAEFGRCVPILRAELEKLGRDPAKFPISKRVFLSVDERVDVARAELDRWFTTVYRDSSKTEASGLYGTPEHVRERLEALVDAGANHLLVNPVGRFTEQVQALAEVVGLS